MNELALVALLTSVPTVAMMLGSVVVVWKTPGPKLTATLQQLACGVVACAIATEFGPELLLPAEPVHPGGSVTTWDYFGYWAAKFAGFTIGVALMFIVEAVGDYFAEKEERKHHQHTTAQKNDTESPREMTEESAADESLFLTSEARVKEGRSIQEVNSPLLPGSPPKLLSWSGVPWGVVISIAVNALLDGLLISISYSARSDITAGVIVSLALTIEMCFVGVSMSVTLRICEKYIALILCIAVPLLLPASGLVGAVVIPLMGEFAIQFLYAFGISNLFFLIVNELLHEAHECKEADVWYVSIWFYIGFFAILTFDLFADLVLEGSESASSSIVSSAATLAVAHSAECSCIGIFCLCF
ncbi:hypothetical protein Pelo_1016 [Pelomyxa schiedti]|nr:hypothetical protein Pelo_1016 [Pelomyxa schiedti]